ncbi:Rpn family recombination-promoting nuclease/putative transposase [Aquisphaera insulae]|uniref:Rpn family recombination-promoting nuclease/putative transposase n=1 Tax=Aquisphaera insulae TaxID=2712864 RepID=UPI0013EA6D13|nr:Rpn family recombination-promoting nuclease/putative transposase [Aquisphaera insulae]
MAKPFDAILKEIFGEAPGPLLAFFLRRPIGPAHSESADLSTVTAEADSVIRVDDPQPWLAHVEFQANYDPTLPRRMLRYNALIHHRHELPVRSIALLLSRGADGRSMTGVYRCELPDGEPCHDFRYNVVRLWDWSAEAILSADPVIAPLAAIADVTEEELPGVILGIKRRLEGDTPEPLFKKLWTATYILMGLKFSEEVTDRIITGVEDMRESSTYQKILREGRVEGRVEGRAEGQVEAMKKTIKRQGRIKFGPGELGHEAAIDRIADIEILESLSDRILFVSNWEDLLRGIPGDSDSRPNPN